MIMTINNLIHWLNKVAAAASCLVIFAMTWMITANVLMRYIFNKPSEIVEEYSGFMFVFIVFMGLGYVTRADNHISVELFFNRLPPGLKGATDVVMMTLNFLVISVYGYFAVDVFIQGLTYQETSVVTATPLWIPKVFMCVGILVFILETLNQLIKTIGKFINDYC